MSRSTLNLITESIKSFVYNSPNKLSDIRVCMSPDVCADIPREIYNEVIGFKRYKDEELPEGHIRLIATTRHGEVKMLVRVKGF